MTHDIWLLLQSYQYLPRYDFIIVLLLKITKLSFRSWLFWYFLIHHQISGSHCPWPGSIPRKHSRFCVGCICPLFPLEDWTWLPPWYFSHLSVDFPWYGKAWALSYYGFMTWLSCSFYSGTGHGVGAALNVHEGPQSISYRYGNMTPLQKGMIVSNEPGYYEDHAFGIRIEVQSHSAIYVCS